MPLKLTRRARSPYWYIRGTIRGINITESTGLVDKADAQDVLTVRAAELLQEALHGPAAVKTFADAVLSYIADGGDGTHLTPILDHFEDKRLSEIGQDEIKRAARAIKPHVGPATRNRHVFTPISAVLHHAAANGWCPKPVIARPKVPAGRVRWITYEEAERLIAAAAPHLRPLVVFLLCTGARISEALYLDWRAVDLSHEHVTLLNEESGGIGTKNGESRGVPLHPRSVSELAALPHRTGPVFRRAVGGYAKAGSNKRVGAGYDRRLDKQGRPKGGGQIKTAWRGMCKRAGITDFTPHDCRHTWATWHYRANRDVAALMQLGGWKSVAMVMRYTHVNTDHLSDSIGRLWIQDGYSKTPKAIKPNHAKGLR